MSDGPKQQTADQWSRFWESGSLTTFIGRFADNYDGDVMGFWFLEFRKLPDGAHVVDLATGNGALAMLATQYSRNNDKGFRITGIDYADIDPLAYAKEDQREDMATIEFVGNTRIEQTTLPDGSVDCAVSQFGFEYADPAAAIAEVSRILKPEGSRFAAIMHHQDSDIMKQATDGLAQVAACEQSNLHAHIEPMLRRLHELKAQGANPAADPEAERLRGALNELTEQLHNAQNRFLDPSMFPYYLKHSMAVFNPNIVGDITLDQKLDLLRQVDAFTADYKQRMQDLAAAARSPEDFEHLETALASHGFTVEKSEPFHFETTWFGHVLVASR